MALLNWHRLLTRLPPCVDINITVRSEKRNRLEWRLRLCRLKLNGGSSCVDLG